MRVYEEQLQRVLVRAHGGKCAEALFGLERLGDEDKRLPFTMYGFGAFMKAAHFQYYLGVIDSACGSAGAAKKRWEKVSRLNEPPGSIESVYVRLAAGKISAADEGLAPLRTAAAAPDPMMEYLTLVALRERSAATAP